jgi:NodT family efflux transporter outer membrane factor (OMF) lipoprotein
MRRLGVVFLLLLDSCAVGPDYHQPKMDLPAQWSEPLAGDAANHAMKHAQWWTSFNDPTLNSLIERAVKSNYDLRIAAARVRQARASLAVVKADLWPSVDASGSYTREYGGPNNSAFGVLLDNNLFQTGFDAAWEIDVFGGTRRAIQAAGADISAAQFGRDDVLVSLLAEVAFNYVEVRAFQQRIVIARDNIKSEEDSLDITRAKFKGGVSSELDVTQAAAL